MPDLRSLVVAMAAFAAFTVLAAACGGADGEDRGDPQALVEQASAAVRRDGMVYHVRGNDGSEVWIDPAAQEYRARRREGTELLTAVGRGWTETTYDPQTNTVSDEDRTPGVSPRINDPMILWFEPLSALALGRELTDIGLTTAEGKQVRAVESRTPIGGSAEEATGRFLVGRVELDPETFLVTGFERRVQLPLGETPDPQSVGNILGTQDTRILYGEAEFIPREDLPADFFARAQVEEQIESVEKNLSLVREGGIIPYWLGKERNAETGRLILPEGRGGVVINKETGAPSLHYGLAIGDGITDDAVVVRLAAAGQTEFPQPTFSQFAGKLPENIREVTARGAAAQLAVSVLTPSALPCPADNCPETSAPLFQRLVLTLDGASLQIETYARVDASGTDQNRYNTESGIIELAEALTAAP